MGMRTLSNTDALADTGKSSTAAQDIVAGLLKRELWVRIGWLEVKRRYGRTTLGPFWNTATLAIYVIAVGIVGSGLWHQNVRDYMPFLCSGMIVWALISLVIIESCSLFISGDAFIRNFSFEYSVLAYALVWRNFIVFTHNMVVYLIIALLLKPSVLGPAALLAIPGLLLVLINGVWIALLFGMLCLRFRDVQYLMQTAVQVLTLITPIFWPPESLSGSLRLAFVEINPLFHLIDVVRSPLLGQLPEASSYLAVLAITVLGWGVTYLFFQKFRRRIAYWS